MAILNSFEVTVSVEEEACPEHADGESEDTPKFKSTYIEATPGAQFKIQFEIGDFLDGNSVVKPLCFGWAYRKNGYWQDSRGSLREKQGDAWVERKFYFGAVNTREFQASDTKEEIEALKKILGTIRVVTHRRAGTQMLDVQRDPPRMHDVVPEKATTETAVTLSPILGDAEHTNEPTYYDGVDIDTEPVAEFVFKYRTKEALKHLMIISCTPSPEPERTIDEMTLGEVRELARRQKDELEAARLKVKRDGEATTEDDREGTISGDEIEITNSGPVNGRSQPKPGSVVIDLTD